jgi:glycerophosphoryl diester phosphodiesterase
LTAIIAHRGGALLWPENSRAACEGAVVLGVDEVQVDVHATIHDELVAIHVASLDRTTNASGPVAIVSPDARPGIKLNLTQESLPLLEDLIWIIKPSPARLRLELKRNLAGEPCGAMPVLLMDLLQRAQMLERTIISAFALEDVLSSMSIPAARHVWLLSTAYLAERTPAQALGIAISRGIPGLGLRWNALPTGIAAEVRSAKRKLDLFGCNEDQSIRAALAAMPDGLSTDRPDLALQARAAG